MTKRRLRLIRITSLLLVVLGVAALICYVIIPSQPAWNYARTLSAAMKDARAVTLVEFERSFSGRVELVFQRVAATPAQMAALRSATSAWYAPIPRWKANCYNPHHRIEIVRADGSKLRFEMCFQCQNFKWGEEGLQTLPLSWSEALKNFFTANGMAPRSDYDAMTRQHPDYRRYQEDEDGIDASVKEHLKEQPK